MSTAQERKPGHEADADRKVPYKRLREVVKKIKDVEITYYNVKNRVADLLHKLTDEVEELSTKRARRLDDLVDELLKGLESVVFFAIDEYVNNMLKCDPNVDKYAISDENTVLCVAYTDKGAYGILTDLEGGVWLTPLDEEWLARFYEEDGG